MIFRDLDFNRFSRARKAGTAFCRHWQQRLKELAGVQVMMHGLNLESNLNAGCGRADQIACNANGRACSKSLIYRGWLLVSQSRRQMNWMRGGRTELKKTISVYSILYATHNEMKCYKTRGVTIEIMQRLLYTLYPSNAKLATICDRESRKLVLQSATEESQL